jgi:hypothetical protein
MLLIILLSSGYDCLFCVIFKYALKQFNFSSLRYSECSCIFKSTTENPKPMWSQILIVKI